MENKREELARVIENAVLFYDPYIGFSEGDTIAGTSEQLKSLEGCYQIIQELCSMITE